jgi:hypothetical protein
MNLIHNVTRHLRPIFVALLVSLAGPGPAWADADEVELSYRLQPGRDITVHTVTDSITTFKVVEDRGIVAKSGGRMSAKPTTLHLVGTQAVRYASGAARPDGAFPVEMRFVDKAMRIRAPDGSEQTLPDRAPLTGLRASALVESSGKVREGSLVLVGVEPSLAEQLREIMASVFAQATSIEPTKVSRHRSTQQDVSMQIPIPGIASISINMRISSRLLGVEDGLARIQQVYSMDFGSPPGALKMTAEGAGGGTMLYEVATQTVRSGDANTLIKLTLDGPDGVIEVQLNSRQTQKTEVRPADIKSGG